MSAARGTLPFTWTVKRLSGVFLLIKKGRITSVQVGGHDSWVMYGPAFLSRDFFPTS